MLNTTKLDTENQQLIPEIVFQREVNRRSFIEIGSLCHIRASEAFQMYSQFTSIKLGGDLTWLSGLSSKAKNAILRSPYKTLNSVYKSVCEEGADLEDIRRVGRKINIEIRRWCINQKGNLMSEDKPTTKECPKCGDSHLVCIATQNMKICTNCFDEDGRPLVIPWFKEEGESDYI